MSRTQSAARILPALAKLRRKHGPQGWWPRLIRRQGTWTVVHRVGKWKRVRRPSAFEVAVGAVLTQNTSWTNVERALVCLAEKNLMTPKSIAYANISHLQSCIRSSGYFRQKAKKLKFVARFFLKHRGQVTRDDLLAIWGIGPETADTILLYGFNRTTFVVDAYTRRWLVAVTGNLCWLTRPYDEIRERFEMALPKSVTAWQEAHALIVKWGKEQ